MHPDKIGRYEILAQIGKGAMGVVYKARDPRIDRLVVLKTLRRDIGADEDEIKTFVERFYREARAAGKLSHPAIVTIHDVDRDEETGLDFIAMEYVPGASLQELLKRGERLGRELVVAVASQVASGLDYAHERGVVHRDIKPANIILRDDGQAKITDFGIARMQESDLTRTGECIGTPNYMSPEQVLGDTVDGRSDQFALAIVLYQLLTGKRPFKGGSLTAITYRIVHQKPKPPIKIATDVPARVSEALMRGLDKDPDDRFPTCKALVDEVIAGLSIQSEDLPVPIVPLEALGSAKPSASRGEQEDLDTYSKTQVSPKRDRSRRPVDPEPEEPGATLSLTDEIEELEPDLRKAGEEAPVPVVAGADSAAQEEGEQQTEAIEKDGELQKPEEVHLSPPQDAETGSADAKTAVASDEEEEAFGDQEEPREEPLSGVVESEEEDLAATRDSEEAAAKPEPAALPDEPPSALAETGKATAPPRDASSAATRRVVAPSPRPEPTHPQTERVTASAASSRPTSPPKVVRTPSVSAGEGRETDSGSGPGAGFWIVGALLAMLFVAFLALFLGLLGKASLPDKTDERPPSVPATVRPVVPPPSPVAAAPLPAETAFESDETILLAEGVTAYHEGRLLDAQESFEKVLQRNPESGAADLLKLVREAMEEQAAAEEGEQGIQEEPPGSDDSEPLEGDVEAMPGTAPAGEEEPAVLPMPTAKGTASLIITFHSILARATIKIAVDGEPHFSTSYVSPVKNKFLRHIALGSEKRYVVRVPEGEHTIKFLVVSEEEGVETAGVRRFVFKAGHACRVTLGVGRVDKKIEVSRHCN